MNTRSIYNLTTWDGEYDYSWGPRFPICLVERDAMTATSTLQSPRNVARYYDSDPGRPVGPHRFTKQNRKLACRDVDLAWDHLSLAVLAVLLHFFRTPGKYQERQAYPSLQRPKQQETVETVNATHNEPIQPFGRLRHMDVLAAARIRLQRHI